jgi:hypothetical protein
MLHIYYGSGECAMTDDLIKRPRRYAGEVYLSTDEENEMSDTLEVQANHLRELLK